MKPTSDTAKGEKERWRMSDGMRMPNGRMGRRIGWEEGRRSDAGWNGRKDVGRMPDVKGRDSVGVRLRQQQQALIILLLIVHIIEWWKKDTTLVLLELYETGRNLDIFDAFIINGTFKLTMERCKTYLLHLINAAMNIIFFFAIKKHNLTVLRVDGSYTKPFSKQYITISPRQTLDALLYANQKLDRYYMAAKAHSSNIHIPFDNTTTTVIVQYRGQYNPTLFPFLPSLPFYNDTNSLTDRNHPIDVPLDIKTQIIIIVFVNTLPCPVNNSCAGSNGTSFDASMNNISFIDPSILANEVYGDHFPSMPPFIFNFTAKYLPLNLDIPKRATEVMFLDYNSIKEIVLQGTNLISRIDHPFHLHGYNFYIVGSGSGNFNINNDPLKYNPKDPPLQWLDHLQIQGR
ncbi:Multicopper oxidase [Theobroma cacao]|nr:Multicopper oxidase [Theobroma cacao]